MIYWNRKTTYKITWTEIVPAWLTETETIRTRKLEPKWLVHKWWNRNGSYKKTRTEMVGTLVMEQERFVQENPNRNGSYMVNRNKTVTYSIIWTEMVYIELSELGRHVKDNLNVQDRYAQDFQNSTVSGIMMKFKFYLFFLWRHQITFKILYRQNVRQPWSPWHKMAFSAIHW